MTETRRQQQLFFLRSGLHNIPPMPPPPKPRAKAAATLLAAAVNEALRRGLLSLDNQEPVAFASFDFQLGDTRFVGSVRDSTKDDCEYEGEVEVSCVMNPCVGLPITASMHTHTRLLRKVAPDACAVGQLARKAKGESWLYISEDYNHPDVYVSRAAQGALRRFDIQPTGYDMYGPERDDWIVYGRHLR